MIIKYCSGKALKYVEEDNYENGCDPKTSMSMSVDIEFEADTAAGVVQKIKDYFDAKDEDVLLNSCDEDGRIDVQILETENSYKASDSEIQEWKDGVKRLWSATYTYKIIKVTEESVKL